MKRKKKTRWRVSEEAADKMVVEVRCWKTRMKTEGLRRRVRCGRMQTGGRRPSQMQRSPCKSSAFRRAIAGSPRRGLTEGHGRGLKTLLLAVGSMQHQPPPVWCKVWVRHG